MNESVNRPMNTPMGQSMNAPMDEQTNKRANIDFYTVVSGLAQLIERADNSTITNPTDEKSVNATDKKD